IGGVVGGRKAAAVPTHAEPRRAVVRLPHLECPGVDRLGVVQSGHAPALPSPFADLAEPVRRDQDPLAGAAGVGAGARGREALALSAYFRLPRPAANSRGRWRAANNSTVGRA